MTPKSKAVKTASTAIRVLLTDDHAAMRMGVKEILKHKFKRLQFGEAEDEAGTLAKLRERKWDLLILDIGLPGRSGVEVLREVKTRWPKLPVLVYSVHGETEFAPHLLRAGANGYLAKERAAAELCEAVTQVLRGDTYVSPALAKQMEAAAAQPKRKRRVQLSAREFQVLRLIANGKPGKAAAIELGLSEKTISTYRSRIFKKLDITNIADLIRYALQENLA